MADKTIPDFPTGAAIQDSDPFESQQGLISVKQPASAISDYVGTKWGLGATVYAYSQPTAGATVVMNAGEEVHLIDPAGTLATLTVTLPSSPVDAQQCAFATTHTITALTVNAPGGASVKGAHNTMLVGVGQSFLYRAADTTWYPSG